METAYEAVYIVESGQPEEQTTAIVDKYTGVVTRSGGVVDDIDRMENRRLAYEIKGRREGLYILMNFRSEPAAKDELDRIFRISEDVLRHMIIKQDERADRFPSKARAAEQERREREMAARLAANPPREVPVPPQTVTQLPTEAPAATEEVTPAAADDASAAPTNATEFVPAETTATAVDNPTAADAPAPDAPMPDAESGTAETAAAPATDDTEKTSA